jgi:undecaprenyl-diphosphatase
MSDPMEFELWQVLVLAALQGVAEFLPISSSGHLVVLAPLLFGGHTVPPDMTDLSIVLHLGTLASILLYYRRQIMRLLGEDRRTIGLLIVGTLPACIVGVSIKLFFEDVLESPLLAGCMFPLTGAMLLWVARRPSGTTPYQAIRWRDSLFIGCCQAMAILPGLSRSGWTIGAGLATGLERPSAATYSFLLAIPAIAGAGLIEALSLLKHRPETPLVLMFAGAAVSFVVGLVSLWWLERWLARGRLHWFAWYCFAIGAAVIAWQAAV